MQINMLNKVTSQPEVSPMSNASSENMEQLGLMASSIAHDFNNLLTNIMGHMSLALLKTSVDDDSRLHIERAVKTAEYAAALTSQLLNFSRKQSQTSYIECVNLNDVVVDVVGLVETVLLTDLDIELNLSRAIPQIEASQTHLQQVIMNLLVNAVEAIDDPDNGEVKISTGKCHIAGWESDCGFISSHELPPGDYVFLQISDNGKGIKKDVIGQIFNPFFSTKPKGRGLGLSTIMDIVQEYHGYIKVKSTPGEGTIFRICFPYRHENFSPIH
jgi:two-component system cell cycle sensor histidine kinase/response regulator CckA